MDKVKCDLCGKGAATNMLVAGYMTQNVGIVCDQCKPRVDAVVTRHLQTAITLIREDLEDVRKSLHDEILRRAKEES